MSTNKDRPNPIQDWRDRANTTNEPTSDLYRLGGMSKNKKLRQREDYRGQADLRWQGPSPKNYEAERSRRRLVKDDFAGWLDGFKWDRFATYTVTMEAKPETVHSMFRNHCAFLEKQTGLPLYAFRADEYGVLNGRYHIHALLGNVGDFAADCGERLPPLKAGDKQKPRPCCGTHSWAGGIARVFPYDPAIGAAGYVSKYVTKDFGDWELIGSFIPVRPHAQLTLG